MSDPTRLDSGAGTRLDMPLNDGRTRLDRPDSHIVFPGGGVIPSALASTYQMVEPITTQGAEADLFIIQSLEDQEKYVLKLYRRGLKPKSEVIEILRGCNRDHVIEIVTWGESDGLWFEVLEYGKHGTLRDLFLKGPVKDALMLTIVRELVGAIEHIHSRKVIHRDLKPENILARTLKPLDLMLADFGIASLGDATQHFTTKSRTIKYGAPEAAAGAVGNASDYWSLGLIILEGISGRHPFDGLSDLSIAVQLATKGVDVTQIKNARWKGLCKGLLTRDPKKRWAFEQVSVWIEGGMPDVHLDELERPSQKPYKIAKRECWTAAELALEFGSNWSEGEKHLARNLVLPWVRDELRDQDAANLLIDLAENRSLSAEDRVLRLVANLGRGLPPIWRGRSLDQASLVSLCSSAVEGNSQDAELIDAIFEKGVLDIWGQSGNEDCARWSQQWKFAAESFPVYFDEIVNLADITKSSPDRKTYLPVLLLLILSPEYIKATRSTVGEFIEQASVCTWLAPRLDEDSAAALLIVQTFRKEAISYGNRKIFEAARSHSVAKSFKTIRRRFLFEILADGILVACLFVALRMWMGAALADDGYSPFAARVAKIIDGGDGAKAYLFVGFAAVTLVWIGLRSGSRRLSKALFGN